MKKVKDFIVSRSKSSGISEEDYKALDLFVQSFDAISRLTYKNIYIIDCLKKNFLYISNNPFLLCECTHAEVREMGFAFYTKKIPEDEQKMLVEINNAGFNFIMGKPVEERLLYTLSYNFNFLNGERKMLVHHKITPIKLDSEGKVWISACLVSLSSNKYTWNVKIRKVGQTSYWSYSFETKQWTENEGISLNDRKKEILSLAARGYTMEEISKKIHRTEATIKHDRITLFEDISVTNITEALNYSMNNNLM
jgi:DNA-binding CsgD family transcriptional regulator